MSSDMIVMAERLKTLRVGMRISQVRISELIGVSQASVNRYEKGNGLPTHETLLWYADYFDVSLDYIYGRTDKPQGKLYDFRPKLYKENEDMREFVEMCFDPKSPANERLKQTLFEMLGEAQHEYKQNNKKGR